MSIEQKMEYVVKKLLGENYVVVVLNDNEYQILKNISELVIHSCGGQSIESHWRECIARGIKQVLGDKIKAALNEV